MLTRPTWTSGTTSYHQKVRQFTVNQFIKSTLLQICHILQCTHYTPLHRQDRTSVCSTVYISSFRGSPWSWPPRTSQGIGITLLVHLPSSSSLHSAFLWHLLLHRNRNLCGWQWTCRLHFSQVSEEIPSNNHPLLLLWNYVFQNQDSKDSIQHAHCCPGSVWFHHDSTPRTSSLHQHDDVQVLGLFKAGMLSLRIPWWSKWYTNLFMRNSIQYSI